MIVNATGGDLVAVTSGSAYVDIDALACSVAYSDLINMSGGNSFAIHTCPLNKSITKSVLDWKPTYIDSFNSNIVDPKSFIIVDTSDPKYFESFVIEDKICRVIDHHFGFETYWAGKDHCHSTIEKIGACATLIVEEYIELDMLERINPINANLLYTAIISNTLNFGASLTTERDISAAKSVLPYSKLDESWNKQYFSELTRDILHNTSDALLYDTKFFSASDVKVAISQLEVWDSSDLNSAQLCQEFEALFGKNKHDIWFIIISDISLGRNRLFSRCSNTMVILENLLGVRFQSYEAKTKRLLMRKEIMRDLRVKVTEDF